MNRKTLAAWILFVLVWMLAAWRAGNDIILPYPSQVFLSLENILTDGLTWKALGLTFLRVMKGTLFSFIPALILALSAHEYETVRIFLTPIRILTKTIPNISYIILAILWLGAEGAVTAVIFMVLFPIFFNSMLDAMDEEEQALRDVSRIYKDTVFSEIRYHLLPMLRLTILSTCRTAVSMGFKVGIMAEIIGSVRSGAGRMMRLAYLNLDTAGILAWTLLVVCISVVLDYVFSFMSRKVHQAELSV